MIVPLVLTVPAMFVFVPPTMVRGPATLPRFVEFVSPMIGLLAVWTVMLNSLMELVVGLCDAVLTIIGASERSSGGKSNKPCEDGS